MIRAETESLIARKKRALEKVPHLKSSPDGRGEEAASSYAKVPFGREEDRSVGGVGFGGGLGGAAQGSAP